MDKLKLFIVSCGILVALGSVALAQWPIDPIDNLMLCNSTGEQETPKVVTTSDGGCYVTWYDKRTGNYSMMMQRLNRDGQVMWEDQGLLISGYPQEAWLTDYGLTVDGADNAIVIFNDIRAGGDWDIYGYKISPAGEFLWGPDGTIISDNEADELGPMVVMTSDGRIVAAWPKATITPDKYTIGLCRLTSDGIVDWTTEVSSEFGLSIPRLISADMGSVILQALKNRDNGFASPKDLVVFKIGRNGNYIWSDTGFVVTTQVNFAWHMMPRLQLDGAGGAYAYWYDGRYADFLAAFVQHILPDGTMLWQENGLDVSTNRDEFQMQPALAPVPNSNNIILFYPSTDPNQTIGGIYGQMIDSAGQRLWGDTGRVFVPMTEQYCADLNAVSQPGGAAFTYVEFGPNMSDYSVLKTISVNTQGNPIWSVSPETLAANYCMHQYLSTGVNIDGQMISVWKDGRSDWLGDIYLQNVNPDGSFGPNTTPVDDEGAGSMPDRLCLLGNYPNPFNTSTTIEYALPRSASVSIDIFDLLGRRVETFSLGRQEAGPNRAVWNAGDKPSGAYLYRVSADNHTETRRMLYLK